MLCLVAEEEELQPTFVTVVEVLSLSEDTGKGMMSPQGHNEGSSRIQ